MDRCGTILVVDHDPSAREAAAEAAARLGYDALVAGSAEEARSRLDGQPPALALVEVELAGPTNGLELLVELHERFGEGLSVILVSGERSTALDRTGGLLLGADDYLVKPVDSGELFARMRRSLRRVAPVNANGGAPTLSPREQEILELLSDGRTQREIARELVISPKTVGTHIQHVLAKLGVHSRAQAVALAYRHGLVSRDAVAQPVIGPTTAE